MEGQGGPRARRPGQFCALGPEFDGFLLSYSLSPPHCSGLSLNPLPAGEAHSAASPAPTSLCCNLHVLIGVGSGGK